MTTKNYLTKHPIRLSSLFKGMIIGALIALIVISAFLFSVGESNPEWGKYWMIRPLIIVPLAGAMGGAFFYFMGYLFQKDSWSKALAVVLGIIGYVIGLWLGTVLGLDGTYWN